MENYYSEIINNIEKCIESENLDQALFLLKTELEVPYIPSDIEKQLLDLELKVQTKLSEKQQLSKVSSEEFEKMILSKVKSDRIFAVTHLDSMNASNFIDIFKDFFINDKFENDEKTMLLLTLHQQKINYDFEIKKFNNSMVINPSLFSFLPYVQLFKETEFIFSKLSNDKDVTISKYLSDLLMEFINEYTPFKIPYDCWEIAIAIVFVVKTLMSIDFDYKEECFNFEVSQNNVEEVIKILKEKVNKE